MMKMFLIPVATLLMMSPTNGLPPLKALVFLTQKLLPLSKNHDGGRYLLDSFRTEHLIPSLSRIKQFLFSFNGQLITFKIGITLSFVVTAICILVTFVLYTTGEKKYRS